ncbi:MAG TPA: S8 family serine peptidase [Flavilitoribacter sp.]|nr:S8 family serine peptidase [Flavilitoribacter sp.]HMQ89135.1 S8 family serine peptidase [Flavilitoribacter sp.]
MYALSFIVSLAALTLWFFRKDKQDARIFRYLLIGGLAAYAAGVAFSHATWGVKMAVACRDLLALSIFGIIISALTHKSYGKWVALVAVLGVSLWYNNRFLSASFSSPALSGIELSADGELLVEITENQAGFDALQAFADKNGLEISPAFQPGHPEWTELDAYYVVNIPDEKSADWQTIERSLERVKGVEWAEPNEMVTVAPEPGRKVPEINKKYGINDPGLGQLWSFEAMGMDKLYTLLEDKNIQPQKKALVAILDTGVDSKHEDLAGNYKSIKTQYDDDPKGHGSHCAGIAGAVSNNGVGVASYSRNNEFVQITSIKVLNASGMGTQQSIIKGIIEAADSGADVISMSLGGYSNQTKQRAYEKAVKYANKAGAIVVAAAGNNSRNAKEFAPVGAKGVIGVSAIDPNLNKAVFSNTVQDIPMGIAAPGVDIYSTIPNNRYGAYSGTSMATPYVAGLVGLMKSIRPNLDTETAYAILSKSGKKTHQNQLTGKLIQPADAVSALIKK